MYSSRGIGRKVYDDRSRREDKTHSRVASSRSRSPLRDRHRRHDSRDRRERDRDKCDPGRRSPDPYRRSRSPDTSKPKRDIDSSAATCAIESLGQRATFLDQSSSYPVNCDSKNDSIHPKLSSYYGSPKMVISLPSQTQFSSKSEMRSDSILSNSVSNSPLMSSKLEASCLSQPYSSSNLIIRSDSTHQKSTFYYSSCRMDASPPSEIQCNYRPDMRTELIDPKSNLFYGGSRMESQTNTQSKPWTDSFNLTKPDLNISENSRQLLRQQEEREQHEKRLQERMLQEKQEQERMAAIFQNVNSIESLINLKESYKMKLISLDQLLQKSILREGEILRDKRRNREGYKDPAIIENRALQNDVKVKIDEFNKVVVEIDKKIRAYNKSLEAAKGERVNDSEKPSNYEAQLIQNCLISTTGGICDDEKEEKEEDEFESTNATFEYYDPGSHWCRDCDKIIPKIKDYFDHLHTKDHWKFVNSEVQPWKTSKKPVVSKTIRNRTRTPVKGVQFLVPIRGFFCPLCSQYLADHDSAEEHLKSAKHNRVYLRFTCLNLDYEHKWNSDKVNALSRHHLNERKRLREEERRENEKKCTKEEQRTKEKEAKKLKDEEIREKDPKTNRSENDSNGDTSERFRLKEVTVDLSAKKDKQKALSKELFDKDSWQVRNEKEKHNKRKGELSSLSLSPHSPSPTARLKKRTYFGDPYKDPKLKLKTYVPLIHLNAKIARKYNCKELLRVIEEAKTKRQTENKSTKLNIRNDKGIKCDINNIFKNKDEQQDRKECGKQMNQNEHKDETKSSIDSEKDVQKENDSASDSDGSDASLVIDISVNEGLIPTDKETDLK